MATVTISYSSNTAITMDLGNLASSATWVAGRESSEIDNTTNKYVDALVQGEVTVGTTPSTIPSTINIYVWGADESLSTAPINDLDGTDSAETITTSQAGSLKLGAYIPVLVNTSNVTYRVAPFSVAQLFGGVMPKFWGLFVAHNTGVNLNATNANLFSYNGIKYDVA